MMRAPLMAIAAMLLGAGHGSGQTAAPPPAAAKPPVQAADSATKAPAQATDVAARKWEFSASAYTYFVPDTEDSNDYVQPTLTADRGWLHLEARYNYEAIGSGSAWFGVNLGGGENVTWTLTPMIGGVFGDTDGVAPGYKGSLGWRKLELYSEGEWVFDAEDMASSFFYNWSELTYAPVESFWFGVVTQRTRAYQSDREIQRGLLVGFSWKRLEVVGHVFNPDDSKPIVVLSARLTF
jgi:hypothetical protein